MICFSYTLIPAPRYMVYISVDFIVTFNATTCTPMAITASSGPCIHIDMPRAFHTSLISRQLFLASRRHASYIDFIDFQPAKGIVPPHPRRPAIHNRRARYYAITGESQSAPTRKLTLHGPYIVDERQLTSAITLLHDHAAFLAFDARFTLGFLDFITKKLLPPISFITAAIDFLFRCYIAS